MASRRATDEQIQRDVLAELKWDPRVLPNGIGVAVKDGVVTLTGWVDSYVKRRAAEEAAEEVVRRSKGVRGVTNVITVKPGVTPRELEATIEAALVRSAETDAQRITVEVQESKVILEGTVRSRAEKQEAERVAWSAPGVTSVDNRSTISF